MVRLHALQQRAAAHSRALRTLHTPRRACSSGGSLATAGHTRPRAITMALPAPLNPSSARLVVIGDVHDQWSDADEAALAHLDPDMALFVGDFGNENVQLVQRIAAVETPKAVILGNHDAWYSMSAARQAKLMSRRTLLNSAAVDLQAAAAPKGVPKQLAALGDAHVGYRSLQVPGKAINIVGARPFSKVPDGHSIVVMGHNGPAGLGDQHHDIVGVDFRTDAGDHGDTDLTQALAELAASRVHVSAVVFGHMHNSLRGGGHRRMVHVAPTTGTVYLNAAVVPRVKRSDTHTAHHFVVMDVLDGQLEAVRNVWVHVMDNITDIVHSTAAAALDDRGGGFEQPRTDREQSAATASSSGRSQGALSSSGRQRSGRLHLLAAGYKAFVAGEEPLLKTVYGDNGVVQTVWDGFEGQWRAVVLSAEAAARHTGRAVEQESQWECASDATAAEQPSSPGSSQHVHEGSPPEQAGAVAALQEAVQQPHGRHSSVQAADGSKRAKIGTAASGHGTSSRRGTL